MKPGDKLGRYELGEQVGEGAMAQVFASFHPVFERRLAIKVLKKEACRDEEYVARFLEDARTAHALDHPNIARVLDVDEIGGQPFIVMELIDGVSLDRWLAGRRLEVSEAVRIARAVAQALAVAHAAGMVHRDIKPSNVLIDRNTGVVKLTDFGAAKRERPGGKQLTQVGQRIGTPRYMAPEQVEGQPVDARTDLFALGATLYELLAGQPAFGGTTVATVFHGILFGEPRPLAELRPDAPPGLVQLVERLLAKERDARPASAEEVAAALASFMDGGAAAPADLQAPVAVTQPAAAVTPPAAAVTQPSTAEPRPNVSEPMHTDGGEGTKTSSGGGMARSRLVPAVAGAVVLLVVAGIGAWWFVASEPEQERPSELETAVATPAGPEEEAGGLGQEAAEPGQEVEQAEGEAGEPEQELQPEATPPPEPAPPATTAQPAPEAETPPAPADAADQTAAAPAPEEQAPAEPPAALDCPDGPAEAPGCALAAEALQALDAPAAPQPEVTLNRPDGIYLDQDDLIIEVDLPEEVGGYLYVDVLTDAGEVYHLLPEPLREDNELPAGGEIRIGVEAAEQQEGVRYWQVSEPFGNAYLLASVSENPLYEGLRPIAEPIADYRDVLLEALADPATGAKAARVERLEFRPRG